MHLTRHHRTDPRTHAVGGGSTRNSVLHRLVLAAATFALALVALSSGAAHAHGPDGEMTIIAAEPVGATEINIEVGIVYSNDEELAEEATVVATLTGTDGAVVGPVDLPRRSGAIYAASVSVPTLGLWTIDIESAAPTASATADVEVTGQAPATGAPSTTSASNATASSVAAEPAAQAEPSSTPWALIIVGGLIVIGGGVAISLWTKRPRRP